MSVKLIWVTPASEKIIAYCARVSNPANQENPEIEKLLKYCIRNGHWSIFEQAYMCVEITTSRAISAQILRHRSFSFQEFSQRYAKNTNVIEYEARRQDVKNRQNSIDDLSDEVKAWWDMLQEEIHIKSFSAYQMALDKGIAKECARMLLPMATATKLYMTGSFRSWIHYLQSRTHESTQLEHRVIAEEIKEIFLEQCPLMASAFEEA